MKGYAKLVVDTGQQSGVKNTCMQAKHCRSSSINLHFRRKSDLSGLLPCASRELALCLLLAALGSRGWTLGSCR